MGDVATMLACPVLRANSGSSASHSRNQYHVHTAAQLLTTSFRSSATQQREQLLDTLSFVGGLQAAQLRASHRAPRRKFLTKIVSLEDVPLSNRDYPQGEMVLGVEIRTHSVKGAVIDTGSGEFFRPGVTATIADDATSDSIVQALQKVVKSMEWSGPVGCSITRSVWRTLGRNDADGLLIRSLPQCKGEVATMIHSEAAAQAAVAYGEAASVPGKVLVCTIGKGFGAIMYSDGERVTGCDVTHLTWTWDSEMASLKRRGRWAGVAPAVPASLLHLASSTEETDEPRSCSLDTGSEDVAVRHVEENWLHWVETVHAYIDKVTEALAPSLVIVVPTGNAALIPQHVLLQREIAGFDNRAEISVARRPAGMIVRGAASWAMLEKVHSVRAEKKLLGAINRHFEENPNASIGLALTKEQLSELFNLLDHNQDGLIDTEDLKAKGGLGLRLSDVAARALLHLISKLKGPAVQEQITFEEFSKWWAVVQKSAKVKLITSGIELKEILEDDTAPDRVVVKVGAKSCRACKKFEKAFERLADTYTTLQFISIRMDQNDSTAALCERLGVKATPTFLFLHKFPTTMAHKMVGGNGIKLEQEIAAFVNLESQVPETSHGAQPPSQTLV
ncbi:hypothetical protein CYMTET_54772 [Cymbomonas tetramitiformis]|uniref:Thioredoxin domain-containing protein n=1 Tax=Cymbomonas tetramitiformis TaxID=36881 RepID=A0AAE0BFF4_9CHLO|nr:hypothetical protein CYMTET_54772 [Cymbomonas tetramitiformis]